jgi:hypothetical protein
VDSTIESSNDESWRVSALEFSVWISESGTELTSCGPSTDHQVEHLIVLCYSPLPGERVTVCGQRLDSCKRTRRGNVFPLAVVTGFYCLLSRCSSTDVWLWLRYSGFQASCHNTVTWRMKASIADPEKTSITRQRQGKHVSALMNNHLTTVEFLEAMFLCGLCWGCIRKTNWNFWSVENARQLQQRTDRFRIAIMG